MGINIYRATSKFVSNDTKNMRIASVELVHSVGSIFTDIFDCTYIKSIGVAEYSNGSSYYGLIYKKEDIDTYYLIYTDNNTSWRHIRIIEGDNEMVNQLEVPGDIDKIDSSGRYNRMTATFNSKGNDLPINTIFFATMTSCSGEDIIATMYHYDTKEEDIMNCGGVKNGGTVLFNKVKAVSMDNLDETEHILVGRRAGIRNTYFSSSTTGIYPKNFREIYGDKLGMVSIDSNSPYYNRNPLFIENRYITRPYGAELDTENKGIITDVYYKNSLLKLKNFKQVILFNDHLGEGGIVYINGVKYIVLTKLDEVNAIVMCI